MTFNHPGWFVLFLVLWIGGGNLLAALNGWHVSFLGYCNGWGC